MVEMVVVMSVEADLTEQGCEEVSKMLLLLLRPGLGLAFCLCLSLSLSLFSDLRKALSCCSTILRHDATQKEGENARRDLFSPIRITAIIPINLVMRCPHGRLQMCCTCHTLSASDLEKLASKHDDMYNSPVRHINASKAW